MPLHIPAFRDVLVQLSGDPIFTKSISVTPGAGGIAFDGTNFYLNYYQGEEIYVVSPTGTLLDTLSLARKYYDIDYDPITDTLWAVDPTLTGIDRLSKADGSKIETMTTSLVNDQYTSIAIDAYNDRCYLLYHDTYSLAVVKKSTLATLIRLIFFPYLELTQPSTLMVFLDRENLSKFWVGFKSFPVMLGRIDDTVDKIDAYRILGASFNQVKASISMRYVGNLWYYWGDWGFPNRANLYRLTGMPRAAAPLPTLTAPAFEQDIYRWFNNDSAENPTPKVAENTEVSGIDTDELIRLRLGIKETAEGNAIWSGNVKLQYATDPAGPWTDLGAIADTDKVWRYANGMGTDIAAIANLLLSNTTVEQFFVESVPSNYGLAFRSPDRGEWDFCVTPYFPVSLTDYYFRAINPKGLITSFTAVPKAITGVISWDWLSDFEADAVGSVPDGWTEVDGYFRVREDQAAVGSHSVRMDRAAGYSIGRRYFRTQPTEIRLQWYWRMQEVPAQNRRPLARVNGESNAFMSLQWLHQLNQFIYLNSAGGWSVIPNSPAPVENQWYHFDARLSCITDKWKVIIDAVNDSGWLDTRYPTSYLSFIRFCNYSAALAPTYIWVDDVDFSIGLP